MPDDAIEREHWSRQSIAGIVIQAIVASRSGKGMALPAGRAADEILTLLAPAFASQQAPPEGWRLVPVEPSRAMLEAACEVPYDDEVTGAVIYTTALEAKAVWSAMLDAAPSVTLGEVG